jgi:hypothetical protein
MSALYVRDWFESYRKRYGNAHPQYHIVLGLYPLEFMVEALQKIGPSFWLTFKIPSNTFEDAKLGRNLGSMLPINSNVVMRPTISSLDFHRSSKWNNPKYNNWYLQEDGTVLVKMALILSEKGRDARCDWPIRFPTLSGQTYFKSLAKLFGSPDRGPTCFAVVVARFASTVCGITLECDAAQTEEDPGALDLVKTGIFVAEGAWYCEEQAEMRHVNWRVL